MAGLLYTISGITNAICKSIQKLYLLWQSNWSVKEETAQLLKRYVLIISALVYCIDMLFTQYKDLLQLMIEARKDDQMKLTDEQIVAHSTTFLLVGYETTSTTLAYVSYLLALNPTIQEKLQQEIDNYFDNNPVSTHINGSGTLSVAEFRGSMILL